MKAGSVAIIILRDRSTDMNVSLRAFIVYLNTRQKHFQFGTFDVTPFFSPIVTQFANLTTIIHSLSIIILHEVEQSNLIELLCK